MSLSHADTTAMAPWMVLANTVLETEALLFEVLAFLDESERFEFMFVSKTFAGLLNSESSFKWRLKRLHAEYCVYFSPHHKLYDITYRELFLQRSSRRHLWIPAKVDRAGVVAASDAVNSSDAADQTRTEDGTTIDTSPTKERFQVRVSARLKPKSAELYKAPGANPNGSPKKLTLPLHQRLALIRLSQNLDSNEDAMKLLHEHGGIGWQERALRKTNSKSTTQVPDTMFFISMNNNNDQDDVDHGDDGEEKINDEDEDGASGESSQDAQGEKENKDSPMDLPSLASGITQVDDKNGRVVIADSTKGLRELSFDGVLRDTCSQSVTYDRIAHGIVSDFLCGYNSTCLVYGQTGSGKTYTMFGHEDCSFSVDPSSPTDDTGTCDYMWGIIPRTCQEVFEAIEYRKSESNLNNPIKSCLTMSYVEVYGNNVSDLLHKNRVCGQSRVAAQRYVLDGSTELPVPSFAEAMRLLKIGQEQKRVAATAMNERSSRAHSIVILNLAQTCRNTGKRVKSKLFLVDLGGSEQLKKSQANDKKVNADAATRRQRTDEAVQINLGLLALKECVKYLAKASRSEDPEEAFIPYKNSKLTMLLSPGLGGNSKTNVVVCASQEEAHAPETISALRFGQACARISNTADRRSHEAMLQDVIANLDKEIEDCTNLIKKHERWETRQERRSDGYGNYENHTVSELVGAEKYHKTLEALHKQRTALVGTM